MKLWNKLKTAYRWYVLGHYHCDKCPYSWEERGYEDSNAGCYIKGDIQDTCRLLPPFRFFVGWPKKKRILYQQEHEYDGLADWYEADMEKKEAYADSLLIALKGIELCRRDDQGKLYPLCKAEEMNVFCFNGNLVGDAYRFYEETVHPKAPEKRLRTQWADLIRRTWDKFMDPLKPYCGGRNRHVV